MGANRIRIAKDKADLVKALVESNGTTGAFQTYADVLVFAASLGAKHKKRSPLGEISKKEPGAIDLDIFASRGQERVINLLAIAETNDPKILSLFSEESERQRAQIFEEYANGGLEILAEELRGAVDYSERLLLLLISERDRQPQPETEFDLTRFLA